MSTVIALVFVAVLLGGVLVIAVRLYFKHAISPEEDLARGLIEGIQQQKASRRHSNWTPALSKRRRREQTKVRDQNYVDWQKMKLQCQLHGLNYEKLVAHTKRIASEYGIKLH